jgi:hypothetical protein
MRASWGCYAIAQRSARKVPVPRGEFSNIPFRIIVVFDDLGGFQGSADRVRTRDTFRHNSGGGCPYVRVSSGGIKMSKPGYTGQPCHTSGWDDVKRTRELCTRACTWLLQHTIRVEQAANALHFMTAWMQCLPVPTRPALSCTVWRCKWQRHRV